MYFFVYCYISAFFICATKELLTYLLTYLVCDDSVLTVVVSAPRYKMSKFSDWLLSGVSLDIKPNLFGLEVLSYLAYETVAQV